MVFCPTLTGSKPSTLKFIGNKEIRWGMKKTSLIKVSLYKDVLVGCQKEHTDP